MSHAGHPVSGSPDTERKARMITAIVRYELPATIKRADCLAHFHKIAPGFGDVKGLIRKQFIWSETGIAGGVYQWESIEDARAFYTGPWLDGIVERYGNYPDIEYFTTFAVCDAQTGEVIYTEPKATPKANAA
jgi:hypothetical protein